MPSCCTRALTATDFRLKNTSGGSGHGDGRKRQQVVCGVRQSVQLERSHQSLWFFGTVRAPTTRRCFEPALHRTVRAKISCVLSDCWPICRRAGATSQTLFFWFAGSEQVHRGGQPRGGVIDDLENSEAIKVVPKFIKPERGCLGDTLRRFRRSVALFHQNRQCGRASRWTPQCGREETSHLQGRRRSGMG